MRVAAAAVVAVLTVVGPGAGLATADLRGAPDEALPATPAEWLGGAAESAHQLAFTGEALLVTWDGDVPHVVQTEVESPRGVPAPEPVTAAVDVTRKYRLAFGEPEAVVTRVCVVVEVLRRGDDELLRERLWIDRASGLLLRRETYGSDGDAERIASYLALDLRPGQLDEEEQRVAPAYAADEVDALRAGGWSLPDALPGGYELVAVYGQEAARDAEGGETPPLQAVYSDGLYTLSLFEQPGIPDWDALPPGGRRVAGLADRVLAWPGSVPGRVLWSAGGATFTLVGDAPTDEVTTILHDLVEPAPSFWGRLGAGIRRLWSWLVP